MKYLLLGVGFLLTLGGALHAQTDAQNLEKYWKLRNDFRDYFVKIGSEAGASIPAKALIPIGCIDNFTPWDPNQPNGGQQPFGAMHWGDGTIYLGHYLTLLATEYRLLKNSGQDLTGIRIELYYALNALNRLDLYAEPNLGLNYFQSNSPALNGFLLRDDVPENFALDNWGNSNFMMRCTQSDMYKTNNAMKVNDPQVGYVMAENSIRNNPSADQMNSIMVGLSMVHRLVDNDVVQPTSNDTPKALITETQVIVTRIMTFLTEHNWFLIDVNGWPVNNMGGDYIFFAYPMIKAAERITGVDYNSTWIKRKLSTFGLNKLETCETGYGHDDDVSQNQACDNCAASSACQTSRLEIWALNIGQNSETQDDSRFQTWISTYTPGSFTLNPDWCFQLWDDPFMQSAENVLNDLDDDGLLNSGLLPFPLNVIPMSKEDGRKYTRNLIFSSGVLSGRWTGTTAADWGDYLDNREYELCNYILYDQAPGHIKTFYRKYLDSMSIEGPFNLFYTSTPVTSVESSPNNWGADYRWGSSYPQGGMDSHLGIFSGLDYMVLHNLYYLLYQNQLPEFKEVDFCFSLPERHRDYVDCWWQPSIQNASDHSIDLLNSRLPYIPHYTRNVFSPVNSSVPAATTFTIQPQFTSYIDYKIFTTKHQTDNATVNPGAILEVSTRFYICEDNTLLLDKSRMNINHSVTIVSVRSEIDSYGDIYIRNGATLHLKADSRLILHDLSKLYIEDGGKLIIDEGALVEFYNGARIYTLGANSEIQLYGQIVTKNAAAFTIIPSGTAAGKFRVFTTNVSFAADAPSTFTLTGKGINDPFVFIEEGKRLFVSDPDISALNINNCKTTFKLNSKLESRQPFYSSYAQFTSTVSNNGFFFTDITNLSNSIFINTNIDANLSIENIGNLYVNSCTFTYNDGLQCVAYPQINVVGRYYNISNSNFTSMGLGTYCVNSLNLTNVSTIYRSNFTSFGDISNSYFISGVFDNSDVELVLNTCNFNKLNTGVSKKLGKLTIKCSGFQANNEVNIYAQNSCDLNLNTAGVSGQNLFKATTSNKNIRLQNSNIAILNGGNSLQVVPTYTIYGSLESNCVNFPCKGLGLNGNQWHNATASVTPVASNFQVTYANGAMPNLILTPTGIFTACQTGPGGGGEGGKSSNVDSSFVFFSEIRNDSVSALNQLNFAQSRMSIYADSADKSNDLLVINLMHELLMTSELNMQDERSAELAWNAYDNMKSALESAFVNGSLTTEDNAVSFDAYTTKFVQALMFLSDTIIDSSNFEEQYFLELDKAHLFRMLNHKDIAYSMLLELESCGIDSLTQSIVNNWKGVLLEELIIEQIGFTVLDTNIVIDTSNFIDPALSINNYTFGAQISDLNNIVYPNCSFFDNKIMLLKTDYLTVYPNPATETFNIRWLGESAPKNVRVEQGDGKVISQFSWPDEFDKPIQVSSASWAPGIYLIKVIDSSAKIHVRKLIIQ